MSGQREHPPLVLDGTSCRRNPVSGAWNPSRVGSSRSTQRTPLLTRGQRSEDLWSVRPCDLQAPHRALLQRAEKAVVHEQIAPWHLNPELHDRGTARGDQRRLDVPARLLSKPAFTVDDIKDLSDDVK